LGNWKWKKRLNPQDIRSKEFNRKLFGIGYDPEEVEAYLIEVANAYQELLEELEELRRVVFENNADELMERAYSRIEEIFQKAAEEREQIEMQIKKIESEIKWLKLLRKQMYDRLKLVIFDVIQVIQEFHSEKLKEDKK